MGVGSPRERDHNQSYSSGDIGNFNGRGSYKEGDEVRDEGVFSGGLSVVEAELIPIFESMLQVRDTDRSS
jgi:hypothetical protein